MTQTKHTPGPYEQHETCKRNEASDPISGLYDLEKNIYFTQITSQSKQIGGIVQYGVRDWAEARATAQTMLAAPELLEALKDFQEIAAKAKPNCGPKLRALIQAAQEKYSQLTSEVIK